MGSTNGITRGQLRPHFSGRSPPFVLAALCVGLGILGVSYWSLSQQYNDLEEQLKKTLIRKDSIENDLNFVQGQLTTREEEFITAKQKIQKNADELSSANNQIKTKADQINDLSSRIELLTKENTKCNEELNQKSNALGDAVSKLKDIEQQKDSSKDQNQELSRLKNENKSLNKQLEELRQQLFASKNYTKSEPNLNPNPKAVVSEGIENNMNDFNSLKANNISIKSEAHSMRADVNSVDDQKNKAPESVIAEPIKPNESLSSNGLGEEDRKDDALVEANNNEIADEFKSELNKEEYPKLRAQI